MSSGSDDKRARILEAAYEVSLRRGVEATRMEEVAARARVSKGTLYRYFESKEHLLLATILESYEDSAGLLPDPAEVGAGDPRSVLAGFVDAMVKVLEQVAPRMNVHYQAWSLVAKRPEHKERLYAFLQGFHAQRARELETVIRVGQARGVFRADADPQVFAEGLQTLLSGLLYRATFDPDAAGGPLLRLCCDALLRDLVVAPGPSGAGEPRG